MPRIDPLQLLKCLSVLLSPEGGILSREEVPRLVNLMTKFSKKLVSKCVYLLILKSTDTKLVDMFMTSGGWLLVHTWLQEAVAMANWNLVSEILELLLVTPVDSGRLRLNNIPKLVKTLSKREDLSGVRDMAVSLVNNWLAIVKSTNAVQEAEKIIEREKNDPLLHNETDIVSDDSRKAASPTVVNEIETVVLQEAPPSEENEGITKMELDENDGSIGTGMFYKITVRDGKQVISRMASDDDMEEKQMIEEVAPEVEVRDEVNDEKNVDKKEDAKQKSSGKLKSSSSSSRSSSSKSSSRSRDRDKHRSSSSKNSSSKSSSSSSSNRDRDRKRDKERDHKNNGASKQNSNSSRSSSSSSSSKDKKDVKDPKETKEKQAEKDKDTLAKLKPQSIDKLGRIPKKVGVVAPPPPVTEEIKKKPSISIEVRKKTEDRPKTVKIFNSKMRSTGLEEEVKPPPPRIAKKPPPPIPANLPIPPKRPSPTRDLLLQPLEKKPKIDIPDRPGAVKLIPPKPKPAFLQESDIFMDALTASASSKKEPKKRKRRASVSKDSPENSPTVTQSPTVTSPPIGIKTFTPANFYQDTLDTSDAKENKENEISDDIPLSQIKAEIENSAPPVAIPTESVEDNLSESERRPLNSEGLRSVLAYGKRKGPKRSVRWKTEDELVEIKFFELDETERVNVSRTNFNDMAKMEMSNEREALLSRKLPNEDLMEPVTLWGMPYEVDQAELPVQPGSKSLEKDIQYAREKNILQALYFSKKHIPDSATEPIPENHQMVDPVIIPLEDPESQEYDLRNTVWPEPKGNSPVETPSITINPSLFQNMPAGPYPNFPPIQPHGFPGMPPGFCPQNIMNNGPPNMMPNGGNMNMMGPPNMVGPGPGDMMNQGPMDPNNMYGPGPDNFNPMMNDAPNFPMPPFNQPNMNMFGPPNNFNMNRGGNRNSGYRRGSGNNNWNRNGPGNWNNNRRGGRLCKNIKNHGFCRNIDNCPFVHPN